MKSVIAALCAVSALVFGAQGFAAEEAIFTVTMQRNAGEPTVFERSFTLPRGVEGPFRIVVTNGVENGEQRVSSATVLLNGSQILFPSDFSQAVGNVERNVSLLPVNTLALEVRSKPGSLVAVR